MKISNPCLEDFKTKITPTKLKKHKLEKKRILELFHFQIFCFLFIDNQNRIATRFQSLGMHDFFGKLKIILEWILYRPSFLRLQHGNWYDEFWMGKWSAGVVVGGRSKQKSSILSSVKKKEINHRSYSSCVANLNKARIRAKGPQCAQQGSKGAQQNNKIES